MDIEERRRYRESIAEEIAEWASEAHSDDAWWPFIERTPEWFDALVQLAADRGLDPDRRRVVRRVVKYLISPLDLRPEFIYGAEGFREDLALIGMAVQSLSETVGPQVLERHGLNPHSQYWQTLSDLASSDLDDDLRYHLRLLLTADAVAGDEDLAWADGGDALVAPPARPEAAGHTIVFAGPGTGKTHRIEEELRRLLEDERVEPESVLVTTFTNKAADELRVRVHSRLRERDTHGADSLMQRLTITTIHGFCFRLISRFHHHALFLKGTFSPMDTTQRMLFLFRHGRALRLYPLYQEWKTVRRRQSGWAPSDLFHFYAYAGEIYDFLSEDALRDADSGLRHRYLQVIHGHDTNSVDERIIATYPRYWQLVQEEGFLDHSMQLAYGEALLDDPQVRRHVQGIYCHVLVDEYQDTNPIQDRIFRAVVGRSGRLFAVADDDQSIYGFRGADVGNATRFADRWPGARIEKLEENRRSTQALVTAASELIAHNRVREPKHLYTCNPLGTPPWRLEAEEKALPAHVATLLLALSEAGAIECWSDVAVLFRGMSKNVPGYLSALRSSGIPARIFGDRHFLRRPMLKAFLAILGIIQQEEFALAARKRVHRPWFETLGINDPERMNAMVRLWHERLHNQGYESILDLFYAILNDSGATEAEAHLEELGRLSTFIAEAEAQLTSPDIVKRLSWFNSFAQAAAEAFEGPREEATEAVSLMTIHKSKGLEFPVVVIADATVGRMPAEFPENLRTRLRRELAGLESELDTTEEERRVLYVGMTRAREYLVVAAAAGKHSPFLGEFDQVPIPTPDAIPLISKGPYHRAHHAEPPFHAHHSAIYNYHFCPRRYLLESRYGFAGRVIAPLRAGQSLHRALEIYHRLLRDGERITAERRERIFERAWLRPRGERAAAKERDDLFEVFDSYVDNWETDSHEHRLRTVEVERPFFVAEGHGVLTGRIDLVREREERLEIVEFKYHKNPLMPEYPRRQLEHYSLAYPNEAPRLIVHYLCEGKEEEVPRRAPEPIREELDAVFHRIATKAFDARPTRHTCRLCPVRFACGAAAAA